jgi:phospholipase C
MGAFGDSYLNHMWLICACTPRDAGPESQRAQLDARGWLKRQTNSAASALKGPALFVPGEFTTDGYSLTTNQPPYQPSRVGPAPNGDPRFADPSKAILPPQTQKTIGDTLSAKGISWAWYSGSWNAAVKDGMQPATAKRMIIANSEPGAPNFVTHHQPFNYFARFAPGTRDRDEHLKDYTDLVAGIEQGNLPAVAFYKPQGTLNQHPGSYADILSGDRHVADLVAKIRSSPLWNSTAIIVTYDENGGFFDHVAPPKGDRWGPGSRIPAIIVSPLAKRGFVDHTSYDTTSIIKFITLRFGLESLPGVRAGAGDLTAAFDFSR